ncbi:iron-sulfur cluster biosynthesis family protein [Neobacillus ginsengisoli]|uniref:Fe-S cluster assembly iron-binding protein IscA n=1 Tax=Neobacillus ginsengisoli TaxID=904295 RepID=A0ABT9Y0H3_9BACI|nr:iron-sulfur cluster biosynthesis family protein [Neobacillus ginsengisoli]MDQ0201249.1 Fe-S cluster assembly iron-binding protein IscA [Neobacillus ginsengisoli]
MELKMTEAAIDKLKELIKTEGKIPRIDAEVTGGCGMSVKFSIVFDEPRRNDLCIEKDGVQIRLDRFTKRYLNEETEIDYQVQHGFLVGDSFISSACALEMD